MATQLRPASNTSIYAPRRLVIDGLAVLDLVIWLMISSYLFIDTASGILREAGLSQAPLSQAWKGALFFLILIVSLRRSVTTVLLVAGSALLLFAGPLYRLFNIATAADLGWEAATALKALLPIAVLSWCNDQRRVDHDLLLIWPRRALWSAVFAVLLNLAAGLVGLGFATYSTSAGNIGVTGYFYAGNEVGAAFAVLCGFLFMETWTKRPKIYLLVVGVAVLTSFVITTKSAILSSVLLALLVPLAYQRGRWLHMPASLVAGLAAAGALVVVAVIRVWTILETAGLADSLQYIYDKRGWSGIVFSGRDLFIQAVSKVVLSAPSLGEAVFGPGIHRLQQLGVKDSVEMDPLDFYLWFGAPGLLFLMIFVAAFLYIPVKVKRDPMNMAAPGVYVTTLILLAISVIAGHVILGGLAGVLWAVLTGLVLANARYAERQPPLQIQSRK